MSPKAHCRNFFTHHWTDNSSEQPANGETQFTGPRVVQILKFLEEVGKDNLIAITESFPDNKQGKTIRVWYWSTN